MATITARVSPFVRRRGTGRNGRDGARPSIPYAELGQCLESLRVELDHKNLNHEVPGLTNRPKTTESLAEYLYQRVAKMVPIHRVRLHERDDFFAEYWKGGDYFLGMQRAFHAAHRLHAPSLSEAENLALYGKCNNPRGHGHRYLTEATIGGPYDEKSGTLYNFIVLSRRRGARHSSLAGQASRSRNGGVSGNPFDRGKHRARALAEV